MYELQQEQESKFPDSQGIGMFYVSLGTQNPVFCTDAFPGEKNLFPALKDFSAIEIVPPAQLLSSKSLPDAKQAFILF